MKQADLREPHRALYDIDDPNHVVLVTHWQHSPEISFNQGHVKPAILLINGRGRQLSGPTVPLNTFTVIPGRRHRFRVANAGGAGACPITLFIDGHTLLLIAFDGHPIEPRQVTSITLAKGLNPVNIFPESLCGISIAINVGFILNGNSVIFRKKLHMFN